jgi:hypothetical protein
VTSGPARACQSAGQSARTSTDGQRPHNTHLCRSGGEFAQIIKLAGLLHTEEVNRYRISLAGHNEGTCQRDHARNVENHRDHGMQVNGGLAAFLCGVGGIVPSGVMVVRAVEGRP